MSRLALMSYLIVWMVSCQEKRPDLQLLDTVRLTEMGLKVEVLADSLVVPWDLEVDSQGFLWVAEQEGRVSRINLQTAEKQHMLLIPDVWQQRTSGLLGMAIHPDFAKQPFVYLNYTVNRDSVITSKLVKYEFEGEGLTNGQLLLEIEGGTSHNGSRLAFGPDGMLYWATGDTHDFGYAQDPKKLNGKILRMGADGSIPADNPDPSSYVWALGFRNMQGLAFSDLGLLYTSEHGDAIEDEVNLIRAGANYGWPAIEGKHNLLEEISFAEYNRAIEPIRSWTPVIAPAGMAFYGKDEIPEWGNSLLLTTLKGKSLRILHLAANGLSIDKEEVLFENHYGRLRDVCVGQQGEIYISTSNRDWNPQPGFPLVGDDKILKISVANELNASSLIPSVPLAYSALDGKQLYINYCASCHKEDGKGLTGTYPALAGSQVVNGEIDALVRMLVRGKGQMPAFAFLSNQESSQILSYIRESWGNQAPEVSSGEVEQNR